MPNNTQRKIKIVADSSSDILKLDSIPFCSVPLKIHTDEAQFIDNSELDVQGMVAFFDQYSGRAVTSCPNAAEYLQAFGDADEIFCITITSALSGSYNAACAARQIYESEHDGRKVCIIDSLSTGPELHMIIQKLAELVEQGLDFDSICQSISDYQRQTGLVFILESMKNLANNGRVSKASAKLAGILGICVVGRASNQGTLEPLCKCRGRRRALESVIEYLVTEGVGNGKIKINHCSNPDSALMLSDMLNKRFPNVRVEIGECRGLCSFYAENGGILVAFEKQ